MCFTQKIHMNIVFTKKKIIARYGLMNQYSCLLLLLRIAIKYSELH